MAEARRSVSRPVLLNWMLIRCRAGSETGPRCDSRSGRSPRDEKTYPFTTAFSMRPGFRLLPGTIRSRQRWDSTTAGVPALDDALSPARSYVALPRSETTNPPAGETSSAAARRMGCKSGSIVNEPATLSSDLARTARSVSRVISCRPGRSDTHLEFPSKHEPGGDRVRGQTPWRPFHDPRAVGAQPCGSRVDHEMPTCHHAGTLRSIARCCGGDGDTVGKHAVESRR